MRTFLRGFLCRFLIVSLIVLPYAAQTQAALIGSQQALAERAKVAGFVARADVQRQLEAYGIANAAERMSALSDDEVQQIAGQIDTLPAGADISVAAALLIVLILVLLVFMIDRRR